MGGVVMTGHESKQHLVHLMSALGVVGSLTLSGTAAAAIEADAGPSSAMDDAGGTASSESAFLAAGKVGGIIPFNGLSPFVAGGVELGWVFAGTEQRMAALLDVSFTMPSADGSERDDRLMYDDASGQYDWEITQKQLVLQPTFLYRLTGSSAFVPFVGLGPRIYFLETVSKGSANSERILESEEQSTKFGVGLPLGVEYTLGPGGLMAQALLEWGPLDHRITGDTHLLAATLYLGYRARF